MNTRNEKIVTLIGHFLDETGMGASYFGKKAVGNSELVKRLKCGGEILPRTERRVREFMRQYRCNRRKDTV